MLRIKERRRKSHLLFRYKVWWCDLAGCVCVCVCVCHRGWSDSISPRHQSGAAIRSPASAQGSNTSQSQQSSTGSQEEDPGQTASREQICLHVPAHTAITHTHTHTHTHLQDGDLGFHAVLLLAGLFLKYFNIFNVWSTDFKSMCCDY